MANRARRLHRELFVLILLIAAATVALADQPTPLIPAPPARLCYCDCKPEQGAMQCTRMCELPKYQNRWWAQSCQRKGVLIRKSPEDNSNIKSNKTNHTEDARNSN
jgi:hypothetical protein